MITVKDGKSSSLVPFANRYRKMEQLLININMSIVIAKKALEYFLLGLGNSIY